MNSANGSDENKAASHRLFDGVNARDLTALDVFFHPEYVNHNAFPGQTQGSAGARIAVRNILEGLPDLSFTVEDIIAEGDKVLVRLTVRGTHRGPFRGVQPTGRSFAIGALELFRMREGQAVEGWMQWDMLGLMEQIGGTPQ